MIDIFLGNCEIVGNVVTVPFLEFISDDACFGSLTRGFMVCDTLIIFQLNRNANQNQPFLLLRSDSK